MNILIADNNKANRLAIKSYIHKLWSEAVVYEENNLDAVVKDVFDVSYELLIIDINIPGNDQIEGFIKQATKYTKVIILSDLDNEEAGKLAHLGIDAYLSKSASENEIMSTLLFVLSNYLPS